MATAQKRKKSKYSPKFIKEVLALKEGQGLTQEETVRAFRDIEPQFAIHTLQKWVKADREKKERKANTLANKVARAKERAQNFKPKKYVRAEPKTEPEQEQEPKKELPKKEITPVQDPDNHNISYTPPGPVAKAFLHSNARVCGIAGPIGSGKSVAAIFKVIMRSMRQVPDIHGVRRSRWVFVRNTYQELRNTTMATWLQWFPEEHFGKMKTAPDIVHRVKLGDVDIEVIFMALDPAQRGEEAMIGKLRSLEVTGFYLNEAKYLDKMILLEANTRLGRFPPIKDKPKGVYKEDWFGQKQLILDTNLMSKRHWYYDLAVLDAWATDPYGNKVPKSEVPEERRWEFFHQPSGLSPEAENLANLDQNYYEELCRAHEKDWIKVNVEGQYGDIKEGLAVYANAYNDTTHFSTEGFEYEKDTPIYLGLDFGLTPACVIATRNGFGQWLIHEEIVIEDGGQTTHDQFAELIISVINLRYPNAQVQGWGDPAGMQKMGLRSQGMHVTVFDTYNQKGLPIQPAPTNDVRMRIEAVHKPLNRMVHGQPGLILSDRCPNLREGFLTGYRYKKLRTSSFETRHSEVPDKNRFSHVHDALQYLLCGGGEYAALAGTHKSVGTFTVPMGY